MNTARVEWSANGTARTAAGGKLESDSAFPGAYAGRHKYDEATAQRYQIKDPRRHAAEMRLLDRAFRHVPLRHNVLDIPCGGGRATAHLASRGYAISAADYSEPMLDIARRNLSGYPMVQSVSKQDVEQLGFRDRQFDTVLCFRLFHHFPTPEVRQRVVSELCRVAGHHVVMSYFSPASFTSLKRAVASRFGAKPRKKFSTSLSEVRSYFNRCGFKLVKDYAQMALVHTMHLAVWERFVF